VRPTMTSAWHRLGVYLDLREDPALEARQRLERPKHSVARIVKWGLDVALVSVVVIVFFCVLALIAHLIGGDTSPRGVFVDGLRFFGVALTIAMVVFFVGRWLYWFADRWIRKS
jgi:lipopolysaccharide/colanic/teichoic acid biosynthesis glycosyltransferase